MEWRGFAIMLLFLTSASVSTSTIILTDNLLDKESVDTFDCENKIYLYIGWNNLKDGRHAVEAYWYNPQGRKQEYSPYHFEAPVKDTWLWLALYGEGENRGIKVVGPKIVYKDFIGRWKVDVYLHNNLLTTKEFTVRC